MLTDQIVALRSKLNNMLDKDADYDEVYAISVELDELIAAYYKQVLKRG